MSNEHRSIQISWLCFGYPCLLLAYIGQAAYISFDAKGTAYSNPFFNTVPPGMFWPSMVMAILAAIVASQATVTATFQLLSQVMNVGSILPVIESRTGGSNRSQMSYFPKIKLVHTSKTFHG